MCTGLALTFAALGAVRGQDPADEPLTVDEPDAVSEPSDERPPAPAEEAPTELAELAQRIISGMETAGQRLADGRLDDETNRLQEQLTDDLSQLLQSLEQQARRPQASPAEDAAQQSGSGRDASSAAGGTGEAGTRLSNISDAAESSEGESDGELTEAELQRRRNLATSVWGHLPQREQDEMQGAFSERFLPAYDELVRQYYETLARQGHRER